MGFAKNRSLRTCLLTSAALAAGLFAAQAQAQTSKIEEVTVTAQKRTENVRKVPLSVSVLSGKMIKAQHISNFADLTRAVPNLSFSSQAGEGLSTLEIRGIASQAGTATVALYLDDVSLTTRNLYTEGTAEPIFLDISRVEVLRGPQSTLYGASALGGTLKYISNQPKLDKFEGNVFTEVAGMDHGAISWDDSAVLNIPLVQDKLALRVAGDTGTDGGYIDNVNALTGATVKNNINSVAYDAARATLLYKPNDWLTITPSFFYQYTNTRDVDAQYLSLPLYETPKTVAEPGRDSLRVPSVTINADLGFANLLAITSNYERQFTRTLDSTVYDNLSLYLCDPLDTAITCTDDNGNPTYGSPKGLYQALNDLPSETYYSNTVRQYSEEIRLVSKPYVPGGTPFTWIVGLYYSTENTTATDTEFVNGASATFAKFGASTSDPNVLYGALPGGIVNDNVFAGTQSYDTTQYSVFGEGTYYPIPAMRVTAGARYQFSRDGENSSQYGFYSYGDQGLTTSVGHFYAFTPKFAIGLDVTPNDTIYANASKGFRLGSENRLIPYIAAEAGASGTPSYDFAQLGLHGSPTNFGPDKLWNMEIGNKARLFGGRVVADADLFYILWSDIQTEIPLVTSGDEFQTNAGNAKSYGLEYDVHGLATDNLTLGLSGSFIKAYLVNGVQINGVQVNGTFPGEKVPGVPQWNADLNGKQNFAVTDQITGFVSADVPFTGRSTGDVVTGNPDYKRPFYVTLDATAGIDIGAWEFTVFGKNLTNDHTIIQRPDIQGSANSLYGLDYLGTFVRNTQGFTLRPLTVGFNAAYKF